MTPKLNI